MGVPKRVDVVEDDEFYRMVFEGNSDSGVSTQIEPDDRQIKLLLTAKKDESDPNKPIVDVSIQEISFPKHLYSKQDVVKASKVLEDAIAKEKCAPCVILSVTEKTKKTFIIPTLRELIGEDDTLGI